jgi:PAS domain S-box-containing protein
MTKNKNHEPPVNTANLIKERDDLVRVLDSVNAGVFAIDNEGNVIVWNQLVVRDSGYSKAEVMGANLVEFLFPEDTNFGVTKVRRFLILFW